MTSGRFPPDIVAAALASKARWDIPAGVCLAQWALESAFGSAMPAGSNNPFGIKAGAGQASVAAATHEVEGGKRVAVTARFRVFASMTEAFEAHAALLATSGHYAKARLVRREPEAFAHALTGVYATDPKYGDKLVAIMRANALGAYDAQTASAALATASPPVSAGLTWFERLCVALTFRKAA